MIEDALREGLSASVGAKISGESEGLIDGQVCLDDEHGGTCDLLFLENVSTTSVQYTVDATNGDFGALRIKMNFSKMQRRTL